MAHDADQLYGIVYGLAADVAIDGLCDWTYGERSFDALMRRAAEVEDDVMIDVE